MRKANKPTIFMIIFGVLAIILALVAIVIKSPEENVIKPGKSDNDVQAGVSVITFNVGGNLEAHITHSPIAVTDGDSVDSHGDVSIASAIVPWQKTVYVKDLEHKDINLKATFDQKQGDGEQPRYCIIRVNGIIVANSNSGAPGNQISGNEVECTAPWAMVQAMLTPQDSPAGQLPGGNSK